MKLKLDIINEAYRKTILKESSSFGSRIPTTMLSFLKGKNGEWDSFSVEASDLEGNGIRICQIYPDSCDEGYTIVNPRTGNEVDFVLDKVDRSPDTPEERGEINAWEYVPAKTEKNRKSGNYKLKIKLIVFND